MLLDRNCRQCPNLFNLRYRGNTVNPLKRPRGSVKPALTKGERWKATYQVCRKLPDGSRQVIASYFTLEEAETRARALHEYSQGRYHVYDILTEKFIAFVEPEKDD